MNRIPRSHFALLTTVVAVILWSRWRPYDRFTWWLEVTPALVGAIVALVSLSALHNRAIRKLEETTA